MTASAATKQHQSATTAPIEIFRERAEARCLLVSNGYLDLQTAVDQLQESAAAQGLLKQFGQDSIQAIMAESFGRWSV